MLAITELLAGLAVQRKCHLTSPEGIGELIDSLQKDSHEQGIAEAQKSTKRSKSPVAPSNKSTKSTDTATTKETPIGTQFQDASSFSSSEEVISDPEELIVQRGPASISDSSTGSERSISSQGSASSISDRSDISRVSSASSIPSVSPQRGPEREVVFGKIELRKERWTLLTRDSTSAQ